MLYRSSCLDFFPALFKEFFFPEVASGRLTGEEAKRLSEDTPCDAVLQHRGNSRPHVEVNPPRTSQPESVSSQDKSQVSGGFITVLFLLNPNLGFNVSYYKI